MWYIVHVWDEKEDNLLYGAVKPHLRCGQYESTSNDDDGATATEEETTETYQYR